VFDPIYLKKGPKVGLKTASDGNRTDGDGWGNSGTENGGSNTPFCPTPSLFLYDREDLFLYDHVHAQELSRNARCTRFGKRCAQWCMQPRRNAFGRFVHLIATNKRR
jgi:hypothetical protein